MSRRVCPGVAISLCLLKILFRIPVTHALSLVRGFKRALLSGLSDPAGR